MLNERQSQKCNRFEKNSLSGFVDGYTNYFQGFCGSWFVVVQKGIIIVVQNESEITSVASESLHRCVVCL